ncbi:hypothetical protein EXD82_07935 [Peptacetobacter hominis]|uniref:Uncharacterized protein n=1 Tax=Peptacetobacter hominis TaxID=2743610 RepID=A0A544QU26_9FIRM|nr:hypothetical protein [Peptacetobacter hominis]TQQ84190.1 hypothetical protein EXD82_07935 [Peptacetobacter hominis]
MEEYLKIKQLIAEIMNVEDEVTETNDLYIFRGDEKIYVKDEDLREVYKRMKSYNSKDFEMYSRNYD